MFRKKMALALILISHATVPALGAGVCADNFSNSPPTARTWRERLQRFGQAVVYRAHAPKGKTKVFVPNNSAQRFKFMIKELETTKGPVVFEKTDESFTRLRLPYGETAWSRLEYWGDGGYELERDRFLSVQRLIKLTTGTFVPTEIGARHTVLAFPLRRMPDDQKLIFKIRTKASQKISNTSRTDSWFEAEVSTNRNRDLDWASVRVADFKLINAFGESGSIPLSPEDEITDIGLMLAKSGANEAADASVDIDLHLEPSLNWPNTYKPSQIIANMFAPDQVAMMKHTGGMPHDFDHEPMLRALDKFFVSMQSRANQLFAKRAIDGGNASISHELAKIDFSIDSLESPHYRYTSPELAEEVEIGTIMSMLRNKRLVYEAGEFAKLHGRWAHIAQFIAGMRDLNPREQELVHVFFVHYIVQDVKAWPLWNALVDNRSHDIGGVPFWRDVIESE